MSTRIATDEVLFHLPSIQVGVFLLAHLSLISDHLCGRYLPAPVSNVSFISRQINLEASVSLMKHETDGAPIRLQRGGISPIGKKKSHRKCRGFGRWVELHTGVKGMLSESMFRAWIFIGSFHLKKEKCKTSILNINRFSWKPVRRESQSIVCGRWWPLFMLSEINQIYAK